MAYNQKSASSTSGSQNPSTSKQNSKSNSQSRKPFNTSHTSGGKKESRDAKRKRWAKRAKPVAKPVALRLPVNEYISVCCNAPSRKPVAGQRESVKDPDSGKMKSQAKGLGKWRCTGCGKVAKVRPQKPAPKQVVPVEAQVVSQ
jgi:hypothetical protein